MATKLFAMEDIEEGMDVEMESSPEVAEVADAQMDVAPEEAEVAELAEGVDQGTEAADEMEEVQELVEASAEEGEGLDPIAAEAIGLAIKAICSKIGANPSSVYSMYAGENFSSPSSRKANTVLAAEGIGSFIADMWKRIKAALKKLWEKAKKLWDKLISTLGRTKKALEAMKKKVGKSSGTFKGPALLEKAPGSLMSAFPGESDITANTFKNTKTVHATLSAKIEAIVKDVKEVNDEAITAMLVAANTDELKFPDGTINLGSENEPLIGGTYAIFTMKKESDNEGKLTLESEFKTIDKKVDEASLKLAGKDEVAGILAGALELITAAINDKKNFDKGEKDFNSAMTKIDQAVNKDIGGVKEPVKNKAANLYIRMYYKANAKLPVMTRYVTNAQVRYAHAALKYASVCLSKYSAK